MNTLLLDENWDLTLDAAGNLAIATGAYAIAQDVASAVRTFRGEIWYDRTDGIPFLEQILGVTPTPSLQFLKAQFIGAAFTVPGVVSARCFLTGPGKSREVGGQIQVTDNTGRLSVIESTSILAPGVSPWYVNAANVGINA